MICLCEQDVTPNDPDAVFHRFPSGIEGYVHGGCLADWVKDEAEAHDLSVNHAEEMASLEPPEDIE